MTGDTGPDDDPSADDSDDAPPANAGSGSDEAPPDDHEPASDADRPADGDDPVEGDVSAEGDPPDGPGDPTVDPERVESLVAELDGLRTELDQLESRVDEKTVHRDDVEAELKRYVRARQRRGHATGWGPYLVLLYGVVMTLGAFYYMGSWPGLLAMVVVWLSTLGLYVVMVVVGAGVSAVRRVASLRDVVGKLRG